MPWTVRLEDENGVPLDDEYLILEFRSLPTGESFPISRLIEAAPYHDTLLNPAQVEAFLMELRANIPTAPQKLFALMNLAERATDPHIYLRFIGD
jgi:hypothetical protein